MDNRLESIDTRRILVMVKHHCSELELAALHRTDAYIYWDAMTRCLVLSLETYIHGILKERIIRKERWPKTWWDAFKDRWFPKWAKKRWPVKWNKIHIDQPIYLAVCPHLQDNRQEEHLQWMFMKKEEQA